MKTDKQVYTEELRSEMESVVHRHMKSINARKLHPREMEYATVGAAIGLMGYLVGLCNVDPKLIVEAITLDPRKTAS